MANHFSYLAIFDPVLTGAPNEVRGRSHRSQRLAKDSRTPGAEVGRGATMRNVASSHTPNFVHIAELQERPAPNKRAQQCEKLRGIKMKLSTKRLLLDLPHRETIFLQTELANSHNIRTL